MTTIVFLVRHGQTDSNVAAFYMGWSDEDLNEVGYSQIHRLSSRLASLPIASVYTSPLKRAYSTATIIAKTHKLVPRVLDDLIEIRLGDWQGLHIDEIRQRWSELWQQWRIEPSGFTMPNGESLREVSKRAVRAFRRIVKSNSGKQVVIVTHDVIIKVLVAYALGVSNRIYRRLETDNASLSEIQVTNDSSKLIMLNDTSHLEG